jgi:MFS family permease
MQSAEREIRLGLWENLGQFSLLVLINAFVGAMVGLERTVVPLIGEQEFGLTSKTAIVSFIVSFGVVKALCNLFAARISETWGRKRVLVLGWLIGLPVPFIIIWADRWFWFDVANVLLGANQALAWSMTVIMKVDLVGPKRRGFALGLNEFAGYLSVGIMAWVTGYIGAVYGLRPYPFYLGIGIAVAGLVTSVLFARDTIEYAHYEARRLVASRRWRERALASQRRAQRRFRPAHLIHSIAVGDRPPDDLERARPVSMQPGGPGEQPERRDVVGNLSALLRILWSGRGVHRRHQGGLSS